MTVTVQLKWTDYLAACRLHGRIRPFFAVLGILLLSFFLFAAISIMARPGPHTTAYVLFATLALWALLRLVVIPLKVRRVFRQQRNMQVPTTHEADEDGLASANEVGTSRYRWSDFTKWKENERLIVLYLSDIMMIVLPKRSFASPAALGEFTALVAAHVRKRS